MIDGIDSNLQALSAISTSVAVTANNVANVNTDGFKASSTTFETGQNGQGVEVQEIRQDQSAGAYRQEVLPLETETGVMTSQLQYVETSNTDLVREQVNLIQNQHAFSANIAAIRAQDDLTGTVLDMKV